MATSTSSRPSSRRARVVVAYMYYGNITRQFEVSAWADDGTEVWSIPLPVLHRGVAVKAIREHGYLCTKAVVIDKLQMDTLADRHGSGRAVVDFCRRVSRNRWRV